MGHDRGEGKRGDEKKRSWVVVMVKNRAGRRLPARPVEEIDAGGRGKIQKAEPSAFVPQSETSSPSWAASDALVYMARSASLAEFA